MTVLNEYVEDTTPLGVSILFIFLGIVVLSFAVIQMISGIKDTKFDEVMGVVEIIASFFIIALSSFFFIVGISTITNDVYYRYVECTLDDDYPAKKLLSEYTVESINGEIYKLKTVNEVQPTE